MNIDLEALILGNSAFQEATQLSDVTTRKTLFPEQNAPMTTHHMYTSRVLCMGPQTLNSCISGCNLSYRNTLSAPDNWQRLEAMFSNMYTRSLQSLSTPNRQGC